jgi:hypothetical protein
MRLNCEERVEFDDGSVSDRRLRRQGPSRRAEECQWIPPPSLDAPDHFCHLMLPNFTHSLDCNTRNKNSRFLHMQQESLLVSRWFKSPDQAPRFALVVISVIFFGFFFFPLGVCFPLEACPPPSPMDSAWTSATSASSKTTSFSHP